MNLMIKPLSFESEDNVNTNSKSTVYSKPLRLLHWLMALMVIGLLLFVKIHEWFPKGDFRNFLVETHKQLGLLVLLLIGLRLVVRLKSFVPPISPALSAWMHLASKIAHALLYLGMISIPVLGILFTQAKGKELDLLGLTLPAFIDEDRWLPYSLSLKSLHEWLGNALMYLIIIHVVLAIYHHWWRRDNTLLRMVGKDSR